MMLPRRVPFIGEVPLPMISSWLRSLTSPTSTHTFDVPMSSATTYLSSVFGMNDSLHFGVRRQGHRFQRLNDDAIGEAQIGVGDLRASEVLGLRDGVELAPFRGEIVPVRIHDCAELTVEEGEGVRRHGTNLGDAREQLGVRRPQ